jgi:hypothetical protein
MSKEPVSPLRQRLIDDITARRFSEDTKRDYVRNVRKFTAFLGRSPDTATSEDLDALANDPLSSPRFPPWGAGPGARPTVAKAGARNPSPERRRRRERTPRRLRQRDSLRFRMEGLPSLLRVPQG